MKHQTRLLSGGSVSVAGTRILGGQGRGRRAPPRCRRPLRRFALRQADGQAAKQRLEGVTAMRFKDRKDAAMQLAARLGKYRGKRPLILGVPRGAVPMARIIADALDGDLDVVLVRKLRAPGQPELAIGAVDESGSVLKGSYFEVASPAYVRQEVHAQQEILRQRRRLYTRAQPAIDPAGRIVVIVDDGIATGSSMSCAIASVRARNPARVLVAIGVAPPESLARIRGEADEVVCLYAPDVFYAVGQFFEDFSEVTDEMVVAVLTRSPTQASLE